MHETTITMPAKLLQRIRSWRLHINVSGECARALLEYVEELEAMSPEELSSQKQPRRLNATESIRITYPESLADRLQPYKSHINISAVCCRWIQEYLDALDDLPDDIKAKLKNAPQDKEVTT